jgi:hypothetical protein
MNKVMKIALAASTILAISFTFGCSNNKDEEKWCVIESKEDGVNVKLCYNIGPTYIKNEVACAVVGKIVDPPKKSECTIYDDGAKKKSK